MQTKLAEFVRDTAEGQEADRILRTCVHCGFCTATCPTYQLLGDELDGPRGRIYQIKQVLEGQPATPRIQQHLDRCLTCRSCETTCPSGVRYARLLEIGREEVDRQVPRGLGQRLLRKALLGVLPHPRRFGLFVRAGSMVRSLLPAHLARPLPKSSHAAPWPESGHARRMLVFDGCAQPALAPTINAAAARVLDHLGIQPLRAPEAGCCGLLPQHLGEPETARVFARRNIDAWWPALEQGAEAIVVTASACAGMLKEYREILSSDPAYAAKAERVAELCLDISEVLEREDLGRLQTLGQGTRVAFHSPCTLQHGLGLGGRVEALLSRLGFELAPVPDSHLCCGSAGTYSLLQPELSDRLRAEKRRALTSGQPQAIATANIGCLSHLRDDRGPPVMHWIELLAERTP